MGRRKKAPEKEPNLERWLVSYADFITLLFAVFVTLYAMSQVDKEKADQVIESLQQAFHVAEFSRGGGSKLIATPSPDAEIYLPIPPPRDAGGSQAVMDDLTAVRNRLQAILTDSGVASQARLFIDMRGLVISLKAANIFAPGSAQINPTALPLLNQVAQALAPLDNPIRIEGFTDNEPIHSAQFPSNWDLSCGRALAILHFLIDQHGFPPVGLSATGFGEQHPVADNATEQGRSQNRRVDLVVLAADSAWIDF